MLKRQLRPTAAIIEHLPLSSMFELDLPEVHTGNRQLVLDCYGILSPGGCAELELPAAECEDVGDVYNLYRCETQSNPIRKDWGDECYYVDEPPDLSADAMQ